MFSRSRFLRVAVLLSLVVLTGCGRAEAGKKAAPKTVEDRFAIKIGDRTVQMQIAALPAEMQKGLMFREKMGADEGMLFIYESPQAMGFWMRNTKLPLDIGFISPEGELQEIYAMYPLDERTVASRGRRLQFALEMNQGWFKQNGVKPGAKLDLKAVTEALKARALRPEAFGLR